MTASKKSLLAVVLSLACVVLPAAAHHSFAMFDQTKILQENAATVREFRWTNPHSFVIVDVKGANEITSYTLECNSVNLMMKAGWRFNTLKPGDKVDVAYYPLRNGTTGGMLKTITLPNGKTLKAW
jgi:hypothetical protein